MVLFLVCPLFTAAFFTIGVSTSVMNRSFYTAILDNLDLYQIPDAVSSATWTARDVPGLEGFSFNASARAMREVLSPAYMRSQAVSVLNQVFDVLDARASSDEMAIDLAPLKAALLGEPGKRFARALAQDLPVSESSTFVIAPGRLPVSRPSSLTVEKAARLIEAGLPTFTRAIPDSARLSDAWMSHGWHWHPHIPLTGALVMADILLLLFAGGLWVAAAVVGGATRFERLQWLGWPLFAPAAGVFLTGLAIFLCARSGWVQWGLESAHLAAQGFSGSFVTAVTDAVREAGSRAGTGFLATGAIAIGAAMGLLGWSWSIPESERRGKEE